MCDLSFAGQNWFHIEGRTAVGYVLCVYQFLQSLNAENWYFNLQMYEISSLMIWGYFQSTVLVNKWIVTALGSPVGTLSLTELND